MNSLPSSAVVLLSGGLDSTVLLYHLHSCGVHLRALSVNYQQRHKKELDAARVISARSGIPHQIADLSAIAPLLAGSALTSKEIAVPLGHYEDENMKVTAGQN